MWALFSCSGMGLLFVVGVQAFHCGDFSCGAEALHTWASVIAAQGLSSCGSQSLVWARKFQHMGLSCLQDVESSWISDQTHVPFIGWWIPIHCTVREVQLHSFY